MHRSFSWAVLAAVISAVPAFSAAAPERSAYTMEILVDGRPLAELRARGRSYVEAVRRSEYAIRLGNRTARRVAVALSVDGLNSIDAKTTTAREAAKWILEPYQTITVSGWQTGSSTARRFFFTTEGDSYGAWLGDTDNLGLVSAAFFRERRHRPAPFSRQESRKRAPEASPLSEDHAATGIGREIDHRVRRVRFDAEDRPDRVLEIRYEYRDALVELGVLPPGDAPLARRERARGFVDTGFAPDPFRQRRP